MFFNITRVGDAGLLSVSLTNIVEVEQRILGVDPASMQRLLHPRPSFCDTR